MNINVARLHAVLQVGRSPVSRTAPIPTGRATFIAPSETLTFFCLDWQSRFPEDEPPLPSMAHRGWSTAV